ncbi:MAG: hypothetical protein OIF57_17490 [Marinobacterium sp.]|nr:hypothetical protein [Marinobacterium sp.]
MNNQNLGPHGDEPVTLPSVIHPIYQNNHSMWGLVGLLESNMDKLLERNRSLLADRSQLVDQLAEVRAENEKLRKSVTDDQLAKTLLADFSVKDGGLNIEVEGGGGSGSGLLFC